MIGEWEWKTSILISKHSDTFPPCGSMYFCEAAFPAMTDTKITCQNKLTMGPDL